MIVWATEFPAPANTNPDAVLSVAEHWLRGSPHLPWRAVTLEPVPDNEAVQTTHEDQLLERTRVSSNDSRWSSLRHTWIEHNKKEWTTEIVAWASRSVLISIRLECNLLSPGLRLPHPKKPHIVKQVLAQFAGGHDSWLQVTDQPTMLGEAQVEEAVAIVEGTTFIRLPIVYVSAGLRNRPQVDPVELGEWLSGMAHVVVEPSRHFSFALARRVDWVNPYGGAVAVFWPRSLSRQTRLLLHDFDSADDLSIAIVERVRSALAAVRSTPELTRSFLQELVARKRTEFLRAAGSVEVEDYIRAFDEELRAKDGRLEKAEQEIGRLHAELRRSEAAARASDGPLLPGREREYYPGELRDAVLHALQRASSGLENGGRRRHIVEDLIRTNKQSGNEQDITQNIKRCFASLGELTTASRRVLEDLGFSISEEGRHYKAVYQGDGRYTFTISKTSSDHRAGRNLASQITRTLFK